jgi:hypothetical protein
MQDTYPPASALQLEGINVNQSSSLSHSHRQQRVNESLLSKLREGKLTVSLDPIFYPSSAMASRQQHPTSYHAGETKARAEVMR